MSVDIKSVISNLCKVLRTVSCVNVQPEHLRQAKFDKSNENVLVLWSVLHQLCSSGGEGSNSDRKHIVSCVKMCFASCHYDNFAFYCLPHNMTHSSRELLLALGWLLADTNVLEAKLLDYVKTKLFRGFTKTSLKKYTSNSTEELAENSLSDDDLCNHIIWLAGRIKQNFKSISNASLEKIQMTSKFNNSTKGAFDLPYLTVSEVQLLEKCNKQPRKEKKVLHVKSILEDYFFFAKHENLFWSWLESVLSEDKNDRKREVKSTTDIDKFLVALKADVRKEILKDPSDDYDTRIHYARSKCGNCMYGNRKPSNNELEDLRKDVSELNNLYKDDVNKVLNHLKKIKINH